MYMSSTHTHMYTHKHTCAHTITYTSIHTYKHNTHMCAHIYKHMHASTYAGVLHDASNLASTTGIIPTFLCWCVTSHCISGNLTPSCHFKHVILASTSLSGAPSMADFQVTYFALAPGHDLFSPCPSLKMSSKPEPDPMIFLSLCMGMPAQMLHITQEPFNEGKTALFLH